MSFTRQIAYSVKDNITVSTIQLLPPIGSHYETIVFDDSKEIQTQEELRYGTEEDALDGHQRFCNQYGIDPNS